MIGSQISLTITEKGLLSFLILVQMLVLTNGTVVGTNDSRIVEKNFADMIKEKNNSGKLI